MEIETPNIQPAPWSSGGLLYFRCTTLRWRASIVTQPCNNWRRGLRSPLLSAPAEAVEAIHGVMPPVLFQGFSWASIDHVTRELSATLYVLRTMMVPTANLGEIHAIFLGRLNNQLNDFSRNGLQIQPLH